MNESPGYSCICESGFEFDGTTCTDKNECMEQNVCENGVCINLDGSYECKCHPGYKITMEGSCIDIDECLEGGAK